jgi:hypothetical protein
VTVGQYCFEADITDVTVCQWRWILLSAGKGIIKPRPDSSSDAETKVLVSHTIFDGEMCGFVFIEIV